MENSNVLKLLNKNGSVISVVDAIVTIKNLKIAFWSLIDFNLNLQICLKSNLFFLNFLITSFYNFQKGFEHMLVYSLIKDFFLIGFIELRYDDLDKSVLVEPVELSQNVRFFSFKNSWNNYD